MTTPTDLSANNLAKHYPLIAEGKTKRIYQVAATEERVLIENTDAITSKDGNRRMIIPGKGAISTAVTCMIFDHLALHGVQNHYIKRIPGLYPPNVFEAKELRMMPFEFVGRRYTAGSFLKRNPGIKEGQRLVDLVVEVYLKDDSRHDPIMIIDSITGRILLFDPSRPLKESCPLDDNFQLSEVTLQAWNIDGGKTKTILSVIDEGCQIAKRTFTLLEERFADAGFALIDFKIEVGISDEGKLILGDVITPDEVRLWPFDPQTKIPDKTKARDKQKFRNLRDDELTPENMAEIRADYGYVLQLLELSRNAHGEENWQ